MALLFGSIARNYIQFGVSALHWGQLTTFEEISQPVGAYYLHHPPLFPLLVVTSFSIFGETELAVRLVSVLASLLTAVLLFFIVRRAIDRRGGALAAFFFLTYPSTIVFGRKPGYEALSLFLIVLAVWLYQRYRLQPPAPLIRYLLLAVIALATASDWPAYFLPPALALHAIMYRRKGQKVDFILLAGLALVPSIVLIAFLWSAYSVDKGAIMDLVHQGMAYMGLVPASSDIAKHVVEAQITFTWREYVFRLMRNVTLNFGMIPFALALFGLVALSKDRAFRGIVVVLTIVALGDCLLFWRSLYFHLWWQHLLTAPLAILSAAAVDTLLISISGKSVGNSGSNLRVALVAALTLPILVTSVYNVWQLSEEQTRMLPIGKSEPVDFIRVLGRSIRADTKMGDIILTNLAPISKGDGPYKRILPYYARRVVEPGMASSKRVMEYLGKREGSLGDAYFLLWSNNVHKDGGDLSKWLHGNAGVSSISVAGQNFLLFKINVHSPPATSKS